ncbi:GNAT family N-acetyltransferase [uncultured Maricaulis sp.]|uniref:GNAT family N-acetyltransferase n=1 Tax=uncultured Maricaulis sp. TaxID=174710 RepID=UPI0030DAC26A|tara:strand:+ start:311273 stop:311770 length:498 start_codon:yes stop_codon:yes gene_type:complete
MSLRPPQPLKPGDRVEAFDSGQLALDAWLRQRALKNESTGASRTYVVCEGSQVVGYYSLATGAVTHLAAPGPLHRNMPTPIPVMLLARLAVDRSWQGQGIGRGLLKDAVLRTQRASQIAGIRALLVHAVDDEAAGFYRRHGFVPSPMDAAVLMLGLSGIAAPPPG